MAGLPVLSGTALALGLLSAGAVAGGQPPPALPHKLHPVAVELAPQASGGFRLKDLDSGLALRAVPEEAGPAKLTHAEGYAIYKHGHPAGGDIRHRVTETGTEDYVVFDQPPNKPELSYKVALEQGVAGARLVANTLEFLDAQGNPRLRVAPPYVIDAAGRRFDAKLSVSGGAVDTSPAPPWGRAVTPPGAQALQVHVAWNDAGMRYPITVDPVWTATGSMTAARSHFTLTVLQQVGTTSVAYDGYVLAAGGTDHSTPQPTTLASAELYNPTTGTWAATASMANARDSHTATAIMPFGPEQVFVAGGGAFSSGTYTPTATTEIYDPAAGTWSSGPTLGTAVYNHTATGLGYYYHAYVLIAGGEDANGIPQSTAWLYQSSSKSFSATLSMTSARSGHTATLIPANNWNSILLTGGYASPGGAPLDTAEIYNGTTFSAVTPAMNSARANHGAALQLQPNGTASVLLMGGWDGTAVTASTEVYDPTANTFTATAPLDVPRDFFQSPAKPAACTTSGVSFPATFASITPTAVPVGSHAYVACSKQQFRLLANGSVVIQNFSPNVTSTSVQTVSCRSDGNWYASNGGMFDQIQCQGPNIPGGIATIPNDVTPFTGVATAIPVVSGGCQDQNCTNPGGIQASATQTTDAGISWTSAGSLLTGRAAHASAVLTTGPNAGKVLVAGGLGNSVRCAASSITVPATAAVAPSLVTAGGQGYLTCSRVTFKLLHQGVLVQDFTSNNVAKSLQTVSCHSDGKWYTRKLHNLNILESLEFEGQQGFQFRFIVALPNFFKTFGNGRRKQGKRRVVS